LTFFPFPLWHDLYDFLRYWNQGFWCVFPCWSTGRASSNLAFSLRDWTDKGLESPVKKEKEKYRNGPFFRICINEQALDIRRPRGAMGHTLGPQRSVWIRRLIFVLWVLNFLNTITLVCASSPLFFMDLHRSVRSPVEWMSPTALHSFPVASQPLFIDSAFVHWFSRAFGRFWRRSKEAERFLLSWLQFRMSHPEFDRWGREYYRRLTGLGPG